MIQTVGHHSCIPRGIENHVSYLLIGSGQDFEAQALCKPLRHSLVSTTATLLRWQQRTDSLLIRWDHLRPPMPPRLARIGFF